MKSVTHQLLEYKDQNNIEIERTQSKGLVLTQAPYKTTTSFEHQILLFILLKC